MPKKYLVILDVDKTLIDTNYHSTSPTIGSVIEQMNQEGHVFVLNSNRSHQDLLAIAEHFGVNGEIIGENGCFVYDQANESTTILAKDEDVIAINQIKTILSEIIPENFPNSQFIVGDTTDLQQHISEETFDQNIKYIFFLNQYRKYSISLHVRKMENGEAQKDLDATKKMYGLIAKYVSMQQFNLKVDFTESYCNVLVYPVNNDKATGFKSIVDKYEGCVKVIIGDDYFDKPLMETVDYFCVVNNATDDVKEIANYISTECITKGVEEILLNLDKITHNKL